MILDLTFINEEELDLNFPYHYPEYRETSEFQNGYRSPEDDNPEL